MAYQKTKSLTFRNSETNSYITVWPQTQTVDIAYAGGRVLENVTFVEAYDLIDDLRYALGAVVGI